MDDDFTTINSNEADGTVDAIIMGNSWKGINTHEILKQINKAYEQFDAEITAIRDEITADSEDEQLSSEDIDKILKGLAG